jgi:hypothetical protein
MTEISPAALTAAVSSLDSVSPPGILALLRATGLKPLSDQENTPVPISLSVPEKRTLGPAALSSDVRVVVLVGLVVLPPRTIS